LRDIFGEMFVAVDLPERGGIDEIHVAFHQFGEGGLGICPGEFAEQFWIRRHFQVIAPAKIKTAQKCDLTWHVGCVTVSAVDCVISLAVLRTIKLPQALGLKTNHFELFRSQAVQCVTTFIPGN
jgi:hypothetical protein